MSTSIITEEEKKFVVLDSSIAHVSRSYTLSRLGWYGVMLYLAFATAFGGVLTTISRGPSAVHVPFTGMPILVSRVGTAVEDEITTLGYE